MKLSDLLFPPKCVLCRTILEKDEVHLCLDCRIDGPDCSVYRTKLPFVDSWVAVWYYEGNARKSLIRYKFQGARSYVGSYASFLAAKIRQEYPEGFDIITWVPTGPIRKFFRGFDQVELLAEALGQALDTKPVCLLKKIRHNRRQSSISGAAHRRANVLGAYKVIDAQQLSGTRILLLDDIITTGSTVSECARVLLTAGAKEIHCGAVAIARHQGKSK
jgi:ComF family protein